MKKAQIGKTATTVIIVITLILLIVFVMKIVQSANSITEDSGCKNNILLHVASQKTTGGDVATDITCPTKYYTIKTNSEDEVKRALAESMKTCWGTWGKGELQLFSRDDFYCTVCSVTEFENKNMKINDLPQYLTTEKGINSEQTYAQYLKFYTTQNPDEDYLEQLSQPGSGIEIDTSKKYAAVFVYAKGGDNIRYLMAQLTPETTVGGAAAGGALGVATAYVAGVGLTSLGVLSGPPGWMTLAIAGGIGMAGGAAYTFVAGNNPEYVSIPLLIEYNEDSLARIGCKEFAVQQDGQQNKLG
jgi:hypothetical protein